MLSECEGIALTRISQTFGSTGTVTAMMLKVAVCCTIPSGVGLSCASLLTFSSFLVDYNSWIESDKGRRLRETLDPDTVLAEGYKEYDTGRTYLVSMGDWRKNKDEEVELDGIGGVNILVKADVHRSGT
jgi:hypothetical protein